MTSSSRPGTHQGLPRFLGPPESPGAQGLDLQVYRGEIFGLLDQTAREKRRQSSFCSTAVRDEGEALISTSRRPTSPRTSGSATCPRNPTCTSLEREETLQFYGRLSRCPHQSGTTREPLDRYGGTHKRQEIVKLREYSKGMQRRIGLAQALINNPELILLDEPTSGLDPIGTSRSSI